MVPDLDASLAALRADLERTPEAVLVLGSGLGALADELENAVAIPTDRIPGYPTSSVVGHAGRLSVGSLGGRTVLAVQGRPHYYEGHSLETVTLPVRVGYALGARRLLLTNAAGGVNPGFGPGTLMLITDHLNLSGVGSLPIVTTAGVRGPAFDVEWAEAAELTARERGIQHRKGVYAWTAGPSYETPAEIRYFAIAGADAVGMSTVPEALQAAALGMRVLGISAITNAAAGLSEAPLDHDDVLEVGRRVRAQLADWIRAIVTDMPR